MTGYITSREKLSWKTGHQGGRERSRLTREGRRKWNSKKSERLISEKSGRDSYGRLVLK